RDRIGGVARLRELAKELPQAHRGGFSARAGLDGPRIGMELVVLLGERGLRNEQDPDAPPWDVVGGSVGGPGRRLVVNDRLVRLRAITPGQAPSTPPTFIGPRWPEGDTLELAWALAQGRAAQPLREQLQAAVDRPTLARWRFHPRQGGLIKAFP